MQGVVVLGSTGSIGTSTLNVLRRHPDRFRLVALTAGSNATLLAEQIAEWQPGFAGLVSGTGPGCLLEAARHPEADIVVNAVVGFAGLAATLAALRAGKRVALANKESLVVAGDLVRAAAVAGGGELVPVDSEHSAVLQCIAGREESLRRLILTASGGPFRDWPLERLERASVAEALKHPTWRMGNKITVDSATLANKAMEVIEAHHLFGLPYERVEVVVHPQSIVHALVGFADGSVLGQLGFPSMELPILYALTHPERIEDAAAPPFDPVQAGTLTFEPLRQEVFRAFQAGVAAGRAGGTAPAAFNAANEVAVDAFLAGRIPFGRISAVIEQTLEEHQAAPADSLESVQAADRAARALAERLAA
ncbi:MAG TPA: 1-deoxy-D-xylulose-5-phosphate reductoisomerase [Gemmatimonadales bacterium]|jgi:1-deoxy-D-xylulose-5-phosphate reductoisomerase|nr:1-deoxy-D-xylulose-5-phosphate reductoisomerase [Gemmatimonadales bacterium]